MPKNVVRKTFDRWLAHSAARFHHPLRVVPLRGDDVELPCAGITPAVRCAISTECMVGLSPSSQGEWWEVWWHGARQRVGTLAACARPRRFLPHALRCGAPTVFEPLLAWTNAHFQASQW